MSTTRRTATVLTVLAAVAALLTGCSTTPSSISGATITKKVTKVLEKDTKTSTITCKKIAFKKGATSTCHQSLTTDEGVSAEFEVNVTMTKAADDGKYEISYERADKATSFKVLGDAVAKDLKEQWDQNRPQPADGVTCPDLDGTIGATVQCSFTSAGAAKKAEVKVTEADPSTLAIRYSFTEA